MTQTAVLHNCSDRVDDRLIRRFMGIYQTSSPSYILMASMDACIEKMEKDGHQMFRDFTRILEQTRRDWHLCRYIRLVTPENEHLEIFDYDRSKLVFSTRYASLTGRESVSDPSGTISYSDGDGIRILCTRHCSSGRQ